MDPFEQVKRLAIIAIFSDDDLMEKLVLKGGNALDIVYKIALRVSVDIDLSMAQEFAKDELPVIESKITKCLKDTFGAEGLEVFDVRFVERPERISPDMATFWGGYQVKFKIIEKDKYNRFADQKDALRRNALVVAARQRKTFKIDISKFEYCADKRATDLEGYTIYVYTPEMIVFEKLRAVCQQMPHYAGALGHPGRSGRARDFFDIYTVLEAFPVDLLAPKNINVLRNIFDAKRVPLLLLGDIAAQREFHRADFAGVRDTVRDPGSLREFDFYFDYVLEKITPLETLWEE